MSEDYEARELRTSDGTTLGARWYGAPEAGAVVVVGSAAAVPQRYYRAWAADLASRGYQVLTLDYRGIGESRRGPLPRLQATMQDWGRRDLQAGLDEALARAGERPVLWVGHSFGGQALGLLRGGERLAGGFTVGTQFGYWRHWPRPARYKYGLLFHALIPATVAVWGYVPGWTGIGEDMPGGVAAEWALWCRSPRYLLDHVPDARERFARVQAPFTVIAISDDDYAPEPSVRAYADLLPAGRLERWTPQGAGLKQIGHFGFFRRQCRTLWDRGAALLDPLRDASAGREARGA